MLVIHIWDIAVKYNEWMFCLKRNGFSWMRLFLQLWSFNSCGSQMCRSRVQKSFLSFDYRYLLHNHFTQCEVINVFNFDFKTNEHQSFERWLFLYFESVLSFLLVSFLFSNHSRPSRLTITNDSRIIDVFLNPTDYRTAVVPLLPELLLMISWLTMV